MTRADYVIIAALMIATGMLYTATWSPAVEAQQVVVHVGKKRFGSWPLMQNRVITIAGHVGESELEIVAGKVRFSAAPCRGKICMRSGWLHETGDIAACVPNRVSLHLVGGDPDFDSINF